MTADKPLLCVECGRAFSGEHGLRVHRARMHGVHKKGRQSWLSLHGSEPSPSATIVEVCAALLEFIQFQGAIADGCLTGLTNLVEGVKALRRSYIEKADQLRKLHVEIEALRESKE